MKQLFSTAFFAFLLLQGLNAQDISYGFKAGLNFSTLKGDSETDEAGNNLETLKLNNGFHVGGGIIIPIVDRFGVKAELLFSQKGAEYNYDGPSYRFFNNDSGERFASLGERTMVLNISNSYLDLPIMAYGRFGKIEISGGVNIGVLVSSSASGELNYTPLSSGGNPLTDPIITILDYNYYKNKAGEAVGTETTLIEIGNQDAIVPMAEGAYYEFLEKDGGLYNTLDIGVNAGLSYFLNRSLFLGLRVNYGLLDATNDKVDYSKVSLGEEDVLVPLDDVDRNLSFQASLGFSF